MIGAKIRLACIVKPGMFTSERLVQVLLGGADCIGYVDENLVSDGTLIAQVWNIQADKGILEVVLPGEFDNPLIAIRKADAELLEKEYAL